MRVHAQSCKAAKLHIGLDDAHGEISAEAHEPRLKTHKHRSLSLRACAPSAKVRDLRVRSPRSVRTVDRHLTADHARIHASPLPYSNRTTRIHRHSEPPRTPPQLPVRALRDKTEPPPRQAISPAKCRTRANPPAVRGAASIRANLRDLRLTSASARPRRGPQTPKRAELS